MARVAQVVRAKVNWLLDYLTEKWAAVPGAARRWQSWDIVQKEDFQLEWTIPVENLTELRAYVARGDVTPEQLRRYEDLLALIEQHRPVLDELFADEAA